MKIFLTKLVIGAVLICVCKDISAQNVTREAPQNVVFIEIFGQGGLATFNYDRRFTKSSDGPGFRIGAGYVNVGNFEGYTIPVSLNYLIGKDSKYFEIGMGLTYGRIGLIDAYDNEPRIASTMFVGFRFQPPDGGFNLRAGLSPFFGNIKKEGEENEVFFIPYYAGISFGYSFP